MFVPRSPIFMENGNFIHITCWYHGTFSVSCYKYLTHQAWRRKAKQLRMSKEDIHLTVDQLAVSVLYAKTTVWASSAEDILLEMGNKKFVDYYRANYMDIKEVINKC